VPTYVIGRDASVADVVVPPSEASVSRKHLRVTSTSNGRFLIEDLNSSGGTFIRRGDRWSRVLRGEVSEDERIRLANFETSVRSLMQKAVTEALPHDAAAAKAPAWEKDLSPASGTHDSYDVFLSYAREDQNLVRPLVDLMERQGWRVFWDRKILPGQQWSELLERALKASRAVVVVWTPSSTRSEWVRAEAMTAFELRRLVPVKLGSANIPLPFGQIQTTDLGNALMHGTDAAAIQELLKAVSAMIRRPVNQGASVMALFSKTNTVLQYDWLHVFFNLNGRIGRKEFWLSSLIFMPVFLLLGLAIQAATAANMPHEGMAVRTGVSQFLNYFATFYVVVAIYTKRLHDFGWSGWWQIPMHMLMVLSIPFSAALQVPPNPANHADMQFMLGLSIISMAIGFLMLAFVLTIGLVRGTAGPNRYGPAPNARAAPA
jgi:uncharacterized membrane protein YhaH (DUF805 family)